MSTLATVVIRDVIANRPAAGIAGRLFYASDTLRQYRDNGTSWDDVTGFSSSALGGTIGITIDGGGSAISTGVKGYISVPFNGTITGWDIVADVAGNISVEVYKKAAGIPSLSTDKISASSPILLSSAQLAQNGSIAGWITGVATNDVIGFNVLAALTVTRVTATIRVTKS